MPLSTPKLIPNPAIVLREEFDDWAILFDPDTGNAFGLNPLGVLVWKRSLNREGLEDILRSIHDTAVDVPPDVEDHVRTFMKEAVDWGLARYEPPEGS